MKKNEISSESKFQGLVLNGFLMLFVSLALIIAGAVLLANSSGSFWAAFPFGLMMLVGILCLPGLFMLEPNEAKVMVFFGKYRGTFSRAGYSWVNPFMSKKTVSFRARNLNPDPIKVNDKNGNPIMIGMVLVWQLSDSYKAMFEIDSQSLATTTEKGAAANNLSGMLSRAFEKFVRVQSDAALRQVAGLYSYDNPSSESELTLRSNADERLSMAGMHVIEARINYLAYAPEIAAVMLRRQQADAIISAREKIVDGAVSMVKMALDKLKDEGVVDLDEERKAAMVSNLLVVLCGDEPAQPVVNSGSLY